MQLNSVLVTGCAGDIGIGLSKILRDIDWIDKIYGCDINDEFPFHHFYDDFKKVPKITDSTYFNSINNLINDYNVELIIPASEPELRYFSSNKISEINNVPILMPSDNIMELGFDKLKTSTFLKEFDYPNPWTVEVKNGNPIDLPCVLKSKDGSGSKNIHIVNEENYLYYKQNFPDYIFQELLRPDNEEYTCGVFRSKSGHTEIIVFKRVLSGGRTGYAEVVERSEIKQLLESVSNKLDFYGSVNMQLRLTNKGPIIFEINPRFSSTVVFRHKLDFKDVAWSILDLFGELNKFSYIAEINYGKKIFRADTEMIY